MPPRETVPPNVNYQFFAVKPREFNPNRTHMSDDDMRHIYDLFLKAIDWSRAFTEATRIHKASRRQKVCKEPIFSDQPFCEYCLIQALLDPYQETSEMAIAFAKSGISRWEDNDA